MRKVLVFVAFLGFMVWAQTFPVDRLEIVGNQNVSTAEILAKLPFKVGDTVDRDKVLAGAKALEEMGYFSQVTPEVTVEDSRVVVRYRVVEYPKVKELVIEGVPPEPRGGRTLWSWIEVWVGQLLGPSQVYQSRVREILADHGIKPGQVLNIKKLEEGLRAVLDEYQKKDIATVQVSQVIPGETLVIRFEELPVVAHEVRGLATVPAEEALKLIDVPVGGVGRISQIRAALQKLSRSVYFSQARVSPEAVQGGVKLVWDLVERVVLPAPAALREIQVEGVTILPPERVQGLLGPLPQGTASNLDVLRALSGLYDYYRREGYFLVDFVGKGVEGGVLHVEVREGKLGRVEVKGATRTAAWVILRVLGLRPGQLLTEARLAVARQNLMSLGYFSDVTVSPNWADDEVLLTVEVKELEKLGSIQGSVSLSPETGGIVGNLSYSQKNLFGTAQDLSLTYSRGLAGSTEATWNLNYTGRSFPVFSEVSLALYRREEGSRLTLGGNIRVAYPLADYLNLTLGFTSEAPFMLPSDSLPPRNALSLGLVYDDRDNPFFPRHGQRSEATLEKAGTFAPGVEYLSLRLGTSRFWPLDLGDQRCALAVRALVQRGLDLPQDYWFALGGVDSVRGAKKVTTDRLALLNAEFRIELAQGAWFAPFFDLGVDLRTGRIKAAPGLEVAVNLGGMFVRLSASWPNDREPTWVPAFEFGMSPMF
ncbi:MAG: BamA/OMP85 family outer membrane protein [Candidatus Bipolaricaulaceae bacterium]